jgi:hypothetical protein
MAQKKAKKAAKPAKKAKKPPKSGAHEFLEALDSNEAIRAAAREKNPIVEFAKAHGYEFTPDELNQALQDKWGKPKKREEHPEAFTCCFSEPPGA